ncbi:MAG: VOC family protein [Terracidiphilus sp.]
MAVTNRSVPVDTVLPQVVYQDLGEAIVWLTRAFGFEEYYRYGEGPSGAQMLAGNAVIQVSQARDGKRSPRQLGFGTQSLTIFIEDVDGHCARAKAAGAKIFEEPHETGYGEYQYGAEDLDGHPWLFSRHAKDRSPEEWGAVEKTAGRAGLENPR